MLPKFTKQLRKNNSSAICLFVICTTIVYSYCDRAEQEQAFAADSGQEKVKTLPDPNKLVQQLFKALREKDFETVYNNDYFISSELETMKKEEPGFILDKRIQSFRDQAKINFEEEMKGLDSFMGWDKMGARQMRAMGYSELARYLLGDPEFKVVETRLQKKPESYYDKYPDNYEVFVRLKFPSFDQAPFELVGYDEYRVLKEAVVQLVFHESGKFSGVGMGTSRVRDADVFYDQMPLRIFGVINEGLIKLGYVGGTPPYNFQIEVDGKLISKNEIRREIRSNSINLYDGIKGTLVLFTLTDSTGQKDAVSFTYPETYKKEVVYWRNILDPWGKKGLARYLPPMWWPGKIDSKTLPGLASGYPSGNGQETNTLKLQTSMTMAASKAKDPMLSKDENILLSQFPLLSQRDPVSYRANSDLMEQVDTSDGKKVKDLACLATVYTMLDRGRLNGNPNAVIDDFYPDPRKAPGGITAGATTSGKFEVTTQPKPISIDTIVSNLENEVPSILLACQGSCQQGGTNQHFVLVVGAKFQGGGKKTILTVLDPYPSKGISYDLDTSVIPMVPETLPSLMFQQMRLVDFIPQTSAGDAGQEDPVGTGDSHR